MTQALAAFNGNGLVLATDGRATRFDSSGRPAFFEVEKLFPLGRFGAILSGGAGVSVALSVALLQEIRRRGLDGLEEMVDFAQDFLSRGYERYLAHAGPEPEGFRRIYFILAGLAPEKAPPGCALYLLGSEEDELPLKRIAVGNVVVMPRNLGMEMRLTQALAGGAPLEEILKMGREFLDRMAALKEEVGPPFYFATVTAAGYKAEKIGV